MEGGGGAAQAQRERPQREGEEAGAERQSRAGGGGGGMKFRVSARAHRRRGRCGRRARRGRRGDRQPAPAPAKQEEALDGGAVEDGKGDASAPGIHRPDDDDLRAEEETETGSKGSGNEGAAEETQEDRDDAEIRADEPNSELVEETDLGPRSSSPTETSKHDGVDREPVGKFEQDPGTKLPEITAHDRDGVTAENADEISVKNDTEIDQNSTMNDETIGNDQVGTASDSENEDSSKNDSEKETAPDENEDVKPSDQCSSHSVSRPGIVLDEQSLLHGDSAQVAESMENSPTAQLMMHQEQLLDDVAMDTEQGEAAEAEPGKGTILNKDESGLTEPVGLAGSPALSSLVKPAEKEEAELPGRFETGMKVEQDYTNGGVKKRGVIRKGGGAAPGEGGVTVGRRSSSMHSCSDTRTDHRGNHHRAIVRTSNWNQTSDGVSVGLQGARPVSRTRWSLLRGN